MDADALGTKRKRQPRIIDDDELYSLDPPSKRSAASAAGDDAPDLREALTGTPSSKPSEYVVRLRMLVSGSRSVHGFSDAMLDTPVRIRDVCRPRATTAVLASGASLYRGIAHRFEVHLPEQVRFQVTVRTFHRTLQRQGEPAAARIYLAVEADEGMTQEPYDTVAGLMRTVTQYALSFISIFSVDDMMRRTLDRLYHFYKTTLKEGQGDSGRITGFALHGDPVSAATSSSSSSNSSGSSAKPLLSSAVLRNVIVVRSGYSRADWTDVYWIEW
jgi:hypothetical protein